MYSTISSGPDKGKLLYPHLHQDGYYVASTSRLKKDYIKVKALDELEALVRSGYSARLKATEIKGDRFISVLRNPAPNCKPPTNAIRA